MNIDRIDNQWHRAREYRYSPEYRARCERHARLEDLLRFARKVDRYMTDYQDKQIALTMIPGEAWWCLEDHPVTELDLIQELC